MKVLITGGLGNLGLWLTHHFLANGDDVTVISRTENIKIFDENYKFIAADITDRNKLSDLIDCYYDICIHTASFNEHFAKDYASKALSINSFGTDNLCNALLTHGIGKFIYLSTFHVYGVHSGEVTENTLVSPLNDYGLTHYFAEKYIEKHSKISGMNYVTFRLTNSYGCPKDVNTNKWYLIFNDFCKQAFDTKKIVINGNPASMRDFIWMGDVVNVIQQISELRRGLNMCFNLSTSRSICLKDLAEYVSSAYFDEFGEHVEIVCNSESIRVDKLVVSNEKLNSLLPNAFCHHFDVEATNIFKLLKCGKKVV